MSAESFLCLSARQGFLPLLMETLEGADLCLPQLLNTSCRKTQQPQLTRIFIYVLLSCISPLTVILNLLVIISISHFKYMMFCFVFFLFGWFFQSWHHLSDCSDTETIGLTLCLFALSFSSGSSTPPPTSSCFPWLSQISSLAS